MAPAGDSHQLDEQPNQQYERHRPERHGPEHPRPVQQALGIVLQQGERARVGILPVGVGPEPAVARRPNEQRHPDQAEKQQDSKDDELAPQARRQPG